jgi:DNA-directed RNA polymerase subunit M/transcription elongation factor TFIIS
MPKSKDKQESEPNTPEQSDEDDIEENENNENEESEEGSESEEEQSEESSEEEEQKSKSSKSKAKIQFEDDPEQIPESIGDESDEDQVIPDSETDEEDETEYKKNENEGSDESEEEIENIENDEPEDDEILETMAGEDDEADNNDQGDDAPDEILGDENEDAGEEVKKRKTTSRSKTIKRRLFPFIQAKRKAVQSEMRDPPFFYAARLRVRQETVEYLQSESKLEPEIAEKLEKTIATTTARIFKSEGLQPVVQSVIFKERYLEILRYVVGALLSLSIDEIIQELKTDVYGYKSKLYASEHKIDIEIEDKIKNPDDVTEDPNYPCPKCGGIKHTRLIIQDRSGDEGASLTLWCESKACGKKWKIGG